MSTKQMKLEGKGKTALITGASAGIGKAFAEFLAEMGFNVILTARRENRLIALAQEIRSKYSVHAEFITADLADPQAPQNIYDALSKQNITIDVLINNAGDAINTSICDAKLSDHTDMIQAMVTSVVQLCYLFLPNMKKNHFGKIINVSSVAAFLPPSPGSLYAGIKSFVMNFSLALSSEVEGTGVTSSVLCPGFTRSEFHDAMGVREQVDKLPSFMWMGSREVVEKGYEAAMKGKTLYINGWVNRLIVSIFQLLPFRLKYKASKKQSLIRAQD